MNNKVCPSCGRENEAEAMFCGTCGAPLNNQQGNTFNSVPPYANTPNSNMQYSNTPYSGSTPNQSGMYGNTPYSNPQYQSQPGYTPNQGMYNQSQNIPYGNIQNVQPVQSAKSPAVWVVLSIICSVVSLLFIPILFGGLGLLFGYLAKRIKRKTGIGLMITAGICMLIGIILGILAGVSSIY